MSFSRCSVILLHQSSMVHVLLIIGQVATSWVCGTLCRPLQNFFGRTFLLNCCRCEHYYNINSMGMNSLIIIGRDAVNFFFSFFFFFSFSFSSFFFF